MPPRVTVHAHHAEVPCLPALVAALMSRGQVARVIGATLLYRDDVIGREGHGMSREQGEVNLGAADVAQHAGVAQLFPIGQVTGPTGAAHEASVRESADSGKQFSQPGDDHGPEKLAES
jgi:hypothetical protein